MSWMTGNPHDQHFKFTALDKTFTVLLHGKIIFAPFWKTIILYVTNFFFAPQAAGTGQAGQLWRSTVTERSGCPLLCQPRMSANYCSTYTPSQGIWNNAYKVSQNKKKKQNIYNIEVFISLSHIRWVAWLMPNMGCGSPQLISREKLLSLAYCLTPMCEYVIRCLTTRGQQITIWSVSCVQRGLWINCVLLHPDYLIPYGSSLCKVYN